MTANQIHLISHALGINYYHAKVSDSKKDKFLPSDFYRNYYNYDTLTTDIIHLNKAGFIEFFEKFNNNYFGVTDNGIQEFREIFQKEITDKYIPLSKSKAQYREYLDADTGLNFVEFMGIWLPEREYKNGLVRLVSTKKRYIKGEFKPTLKEAKVSYKDALKASKSCK